MSTSLDKKLTARQRPKCFISYCHEDVDQDLLDYVRYILSKSGHADYELLVDRDLHYGANLRDFMALLEQVDAVLLLLTPAYKQRVLKRAGGVYTEYTTIHNRYQLFHEQKRFGQVDRYFELIPILLSGTTSDSVPDDISHLKYLDITGLRPQRGVAGQYVISDYARARYSTELAKVGGRLQAIDVRSYYDRLFVDLKAAVADFKTASTFLESLFVKTYAYKRVAREDVYFIIGRKGSGKSTIANMLRAINPDRFAAHLPVYVDDISLELPYALFTIGGVDSDTSMIVSRHDCFTFAWEAFFYLCCTDEFCQAKNDVVTEEEQARLRAILLQLQPDLDIEPFERRKAYAAYAFTSVIEFLDETIHGARSEPRVFYSDIQTRFSRQRFLQYAVGDEVIRIVDGAVSRSGQKVLITLDGFDTAFDRFRFTSLATHRRSDLVRRATFEVDWLRALLLLILEYKTSRTTTTLAGCVQVCMTVPQDRFLEVLATDRDRYRFTGRFCSLTWSGIELAILLRKRLAMLAGADVPRALSPEDRLEQLLTKHFSHIPTEIELTYNGRTHRMPTFLYVLRHTFWRPREVLIYYANLLSAGEELRARGASMSSDTVRRVVKETTYQIIQSEFISEYMSSFVRIRDVIRAFIRQPVSLTYDELTKILGVVQFSLASQDEGAQESILSKVDLLYRMGFLGLKVPHKRRESMGLMNEHVFFFTEGAVFLRNAPANPFSQMSFVINPAFHEYLELIPSKEFVLKLSWSYLHQLEAVLSATSAW